MGLVSPPALHPLLVVDGSILTDCLLMLVSPAILATHATRNISVSTGFGESLSISTPGGVRPKRSVFARP